MTFKTRRQFCGLTMSSKDSILNLLNKGFVDVYFSLKFVILTAFFCNLTASLICWFLVCPQISQPSHVQLKRALYIVVNSLLEV